MMRCVLSLIVILSLFISVAPVHAVGYSTVGMKGHIKKFSLKKDKNVISETDFEFAKMDYMLIEVNKVDNPSRFSSLKDKYSFVKLAKKAIKLYKGYNNVVNLGWLGNLVEYKIYSLIDVIENSSFYVNNYNKIVEIYGSSVVLKDVGYKEIPLDYKYKWIYETQDYCLYEDVSIMPVINIEKPVTHKQDGRSLSNRFYDYVKKNHSIDIMNQLKKLSLNRAKAQFIKQFKRKIF